jgi:hypothetical protein
VWARINVGLGCPYCSGKRALSGFNDLATTHPNIAAEAVPPLPVVTSYSNKKLQWQCQLGHEYSQIVANRVGQNQGCPFCANKKVLVGFNDLQSTHPEIAVEAEGWDPTTVTFGSSAMRFWICTKGHKWKSAINSRTSGYGCPSCAQTGFDPNQPGFIYFIDHFVLQMFQIGITNFPDKRLDKHKRSGWEVIELRGPMDGLLTRQLETNCLHALEKRGAILGNKAGIDKFDGYSEAWTKASLNVTSIKQILDWVYEDEGAVTK